MLCLDERTRSIAGLDDDRRLSERRHRDVPFGEEMPLTLKMVIGVLGSIPGYGKLWGCWNAYAWQRAGVVISLPP